MWADSYSLAEHLETRFSTEIKRRGEEYFEMGLVDITSVEPSVITGAVQGGRIYTATIAWEGTTSGPYFFCDCPSFEHTAECKHLWALVLAIDERELGRGSAESREQEAEGRGRAPTSDWRWRLSSTRRANTLVSRDPWEGIETGEYELRYVVDVPASRETEALEVETIFHRRLQGERWDAGRPFVLGSRNAPPLTSASDRRIFAALIGAAGEEEFEGHASYEPSARITPSAYSLGSELVRELLPLMAMSGRLHWRDFETLGGPLVLDPGPPWHFRVRSTRAEDAREVVIEGFFERDTPEHELLSLESPLLVLPSDFLLGPQSVALFDSGGALGLLTELRRRGPVHAPLADQEEALQLLAGHSRAVLSAVDEFEWADDVTPRPHLFVAPAPTTHKRRRLACQIEFDYGGTRIDPHEPQRTFARRGDPRLVRRDFAAEQRALREFLVLGGRTTATDSLNGVIGTIIAGELPDFVRALLGAGWTVEAEGVRWRAEGIVRVSVSSGTDWFDLQGGVDFDGEVVPLPALLEAAAGGRSTVTLGDGSVGILPETWLARAGLLELGGTAADEGLRFKHCHGLLLDALLAERENVTLDEGFTRFRERLAGFEGITSKMEPRSFQGTLREYQREGLGWFDFLEELGFGGCLADDMGLGKTVQVLALLEGRRSDRTVARKDKRPSLVVAPKSLIFNWIDEAERFAPKLRVIDYTGQDRAVHIEAIAKADLVVTTYGTLRRDIATLKDVHFDYAVLDEAQAIKNSLSQAAKAARLLTADHRLALSGTPIENHLGELWSLFEFLNPGMLGRSAFFQRLVSGKGKKRGPALPAPDLSTLAHAVRPFFLRRTKEAVLTDLPAKTEQALYCELESKQRAEYDELRDHYRAALLGGQTEEGLATNRIQVLEALLRLRQAACHSGLIDPNRAGAESAKLETVLPMLEELVREGHKGLVFSQFTKFLAIVRKKLDEKGIPYEYLDGSTRKRKEKVMRFQNDEACPLFLISLKAGGHGLNLTAADYVFLLDPWWNPAVEAQAVDRAHRMGQTKPVLAYRLIARNTIEEKVLELQAHKRDLAKAVLGESQALLKDLTREDLERLLS